jgi:predicted RNase H-like nuclease (RuvC/YqgF family)
MEPTSPSTSSSRNSPFENLSEETSSHDTDARAQEMSLALLRNAQQHPTDMDVKDREHRELNKMVSVLSEENTNLKADLESLEVEQTNLLLRLNKAQENNEELIKMSSDRERQHKDEIDRLTSRIDQLTLQMAGFQSQLTSSRILGYHKIAMGILVSTFFGMAGMLCWKMVKIK